jgi:hypothetical protein
MQVSSPISGRSRGWIAARIASRSARRDGREQVGCIILGRGSNEQKVVEWLRAAAHVPGFIGFAVGRTSFWEALVEWRDGKIQRQEAVEKIARRYLEWVRVFEGEHWLTITLAFRAYDSNTVDFAPVGPVESPPTLRPKRQRRETHRSSMMRPIATMSQSAMWPNRAPRASASPIFAIACSDSSTPFSAMPSS